MKHEVQYLEHSYFEMILIFHFLSKQPFDCLWCFSPNITCVWGPVPDTLKNNNALKAFRRKEGMFRAGVSSRVSWDQFYPANWKQLSRECFGEEKRYRSLRIGEECERMPVQVLNPTMLKQRYQSHSFIHLYFEKSLLSTARTVGRYKRAVNRTNCNLSFTNRRKEKQKIIPWLRFLRSILHESHHNEVKENMEGNREYW